MLASMRCIVLLSTLLLQGCVRASTLQPPVLPLIVRNPYFSTWLSNARDVPWSAWPIFYTGEEVYDLQFQRRSSLILVRLDFPSWPQCQDPAKSTLFLEDPTILCTQMITGG